MTRPVPPIVAERHRQGLLPPDEADDVRRRLAEHGDPLAGLPTDEQVFADDPPEAFAREVRRRVAEAEWAERRSARGWRVVAGGAVVAVALLAFLSVDVGTNPLGPGDVIVKGDTAPRLTVWRASDQGPVRLDATSVAAEGDRLQLAFVAPGATHGVLFSVDGRGVVTEHRRLEGAPVNGEVVLPDAYVLDDAPGFEAFHLVVADGPLDVDAVLAAARAAGASEAPPDVPEDARVTSFVLRKVAR